MAIKVTPTKFSGLVIIEPSSFMDNRGFFMETYHKKTYETAGLRKFFVQDNISYSMQNVLRGLHYQLSHPQGKLIYVISGEIFDVAVDIRKGSPTFGQWEGVNLSSENKKQIYIPEGFAHGFVVLSQTAYVAYKCTALYTPGDEYGIFWDDPDIRIDWPIDTPILSDKDNRNLKLSNVPESDLPVYNG
jgi:dTDP-4-dehydrorhamnose 3,5-epimerase